MSDIVHPLPNPVEQIAYAQNGEDVVLCRAFSSSPAGFYVDVGAGHPIEGSVTKNLIDRFQWRGLDIEPQHTLARLLREAHPGCTVVEAAVGTRARTQAFYRLTDNWGMSTLDESVAHRHVQAGWTMVEETTTVMPLDDILRDNNVGQIDLLKVDVEGFELEVLRSIDLTYWRPRVLVAEATAPASTSQSHQDWDWLVLKAGYELCFFDGLNRFYALSEESDLRKKLAVPANVFDRYIPLRWWRSLSDAGRELADPTHRFEIIT